MMVLFCLFGSPLSWVHWWVVEVVLRIHGWSHFFPRLTGGGGRSDSTETCVTDGILIPIAAAARVAVTSCAIAFSPTSPEMKVFGFSARDLSISSLSISSSCSRFLLSRSPAYPSAFALTLRISARIPAIFADVSALMR